MLGFLGILQESLRRGHQQDPEIQIVFLFNVPNRITEVKCQQSLISLIY